MWDEAKNFETIVSLMEVGFSSASLQLTKTNTSEQLQHDKENFQPDNRVPEYCALTL